LTKTYKDRRQPRVRKTNAATALSEVSRLKDDGDNFRQWKEELIRHSLATLEVKSEEDVTVLTQIVSVDDGGDPLLLDR
jgi:hypothetical protein